MKQMAVVCRNSKYLGVTEAIIQCVLRAQQEYILYEDSLHPDNCKWYASDLNYGYILRNPKKGWVD